MKMKQFLITGFLFIGFLSLYAEVKPSGMFTNHMVLQRDMPVPVWGKADPGEKVTVNFTGQSKTVVAGNDGKWMIKLEPLKASFEGNSMLIKGTNTVKFTDVLVGEVWICSGQSNMERGVLCVPELKKLIPEAKKMPVRSFEVAQHISLKPADTPVGTWKSQPPTSAVAFGFSYFLQKSIGVPIGIIQTCWGSSSIEGWMPIEMTEELPHFKKIMDEFYADKDKMKVINMLIDQYKKNHRIKKYTDDEAENQRLTKKYRNANICARISPNLLYNAMLHPLIPYAVKGMVWYQGEANTRNADMMKQYAQSLQLWVKKLRSLWDNDNFEFLAVMLPGFGRVMGGGNKDIKYPGSLTWAAMRESQMKILELPHTAVANTIDLGDVKNIHPRDKKPLCERLALLAEHYAYGKNVVPAGPIFKNAKISGNKMTIEYTNATGLKTKDGQSPTGFWLAGKDKKWYKANAEIIGDKVVLTSDKVAEPVACRYAYAAKPEVNLVNKADLPAYPFRTDSW